MNFEKYSKRHFETLGLDSPAARKLADDLEDDVKKELQPIIIGAFQRIIEGLNAKGHNLKAYGEIKLGDIPFRDESEEKCNLRLACDFVISAGYADTISES
jgi:hypothetical protein